MKMLLRGLSTITILCFATMIFAAAKAPVNDSDPVAMLENVSTQLITTLKKNKVRIRRDTPFLQSQVRNVVLPVFDLDRMSHAVVGRNHWGKATAEQKSTFKTEFTQLVLQIYSAPLANFNDDKITFAPLRSNAKGKTRVQVHSTINRKSGQKIPVVYRLVKKGGQWRVYDFSVEGISMVESYRSQFSGVLSQSGFSGLLKKVAEHNRKA